VNNDGWLDLYLGTGEPSYLALVPNVLFQNEQGVHFFDVTFSSGVGHLQKGHGVAFGDLDNDGDQDLFHQLGGFYPGDGFSNALFENPGNENAWITLRLDGRRANRFGVGARIEVRIIEAKGSRSIHLLAGSGGSFGGSSMQQEIGLGDAQRIEEIRIRWPGNEGVQIFRDVRPNRFYRAVEGRAELIEEERPQLSLGNSKRPSVGHEH
ncbi:MAG: CRTAC1 family protein, partial [Myxococcota bacterium]